MKKSQITVFLILGIVLLFGVGFFMFSKGKSSVVDSGRTISSDPIENYIQQCVDKTAEDAVIMAGLEGGVLNPNNSIDFFDGSVPVYMVFNDSKVPGFQDVEFYLSDYLNSNLKNCINFSLFPDHSIEEGLVNTKINSNNNSVVFSVTFPVKIKKSSSVKEISSFSSKVDTRLKQIYSAISDYVLEQKKTPDRICLSCINKLDYKYNLTTEMNPYGNLVFFTVSDLNYPVNKKRFEYRFLMLFEEAKK